MNLHSAQVDAFAIATQLGLRRRGNRYWCPACQSGKGHTSPDFSLTRAGLWICHKCGVHGSLAALVMLVNGCDYHAAVAWLADATKGGAAYQPVVGRQSQAIGYVAREITPLTPTERSSIYRRMLGMCLSCSHAVAEQWLAAKGLTGETLDRLGVRSLPTELQWPVYRQLEREFGLNKMLAANLCAESDDQSAIWPRGATYFRRGIPVLVIPYHDRGEIVGLKLRPVVTGQLPHSVPRFVMCGSGPLYNMNVLAVPFECDAAIFLCEGESDCWSLAQSGLNAIAIAGCSNVKALERCDVLRELRRREVCCGFDADAAGDRAADELCALFIKHGLPAPTRVKLPCGCKDLNELIQLAAA